MPDANTVPHRQGPDPTLPPITAASTLETSAAPPELVELLTSYFVAKSAADVPAILKHFSRNFTTYTDAPLRWAVNGYEALEKAFGAASVHYAGGRSYPTRISGWLVGGNGSAMVHITNTPEIVGSELRMLCAMDFRGGLITRILDYWDSTSFPDDLFEKIQKTSNRPADYLENEVGQAASAALIALANSLHSALAAGNAEGAGELFDDDVVLEDMGLCVQILGKSAVIRYLTRVLSSAPYGKGSRLRHIVGGDLGGGFEWIGSADGGVEGGMTSLSLSPGGRITRLTTVYDSRQLRVRDKRSQVELAANGLVPA